MCNWQKGLGGLVAASKGMQRDGFYDETSYSIAVGAYPSG